MKLILLSLIAVNSYAKSVSEMTYEEAMDSYSKLQKEVSNMSYEEAMNSYHEKTRSPQSTEKK